MEEEIIITNPQFKEPVMTPVFMDNVLEIEVMMSNTYTLPDITITKR